MFKRGEIVKIKGTNQSYKILEINKFGIKLNKVDRSWYSEDELIFFEGNQISSTLVDNLKVGDTYYLYGVGSVRVEYINNKFIKLTNKNGDYWDVDLNGCSLSTGDQLLFPSKDERNWDNYFQNINESIKTWSDLVSINRHKVSTVRISETSCTAEGSAEKSALALLKIRQLINYSYGGYVTWEDNLSKAHERYYTITPNIDINGYQGLRVTSAVFLDNLHISFHTKEQAYEFMSYPENEQLIKEYYGIELLSLKKNL